MRDHGGGSCRLVVCVCNNLFATTDGASSALSRVQDYLHVPPPVDPENRETTEQRDERPRRARSVSLGGRRAESCRQLIHSDVIHTDVHSAAVVVVCRVQIHY